MGTPEFACSALSALFKGPYEIVLVVTQPDKPVGRKQVMTPPPVKQLALEHGIEVFQPSKLRNNPEALAKLAAAKADLFVVVAYGKILPQNILDLPTRGCINVHASLLPELRGAAPIQWSIVRGNATTGITTMLMDAGMDTGDMLLQRELPVTDTDTGITLSDKLSQLGGELMIETLPQWLSGELKARPQDNSLATMAPILKKEDGLIQWQHSATQIANQVRGLQPWPEAYTVFRGKTLKIKQAHVVSTADAERGVPGQVLELTPQGFLVATGQGILAVERVHLADSKEMSATDFARGQRLEPAEIFGNAQFC